MASHSRTSAPAPRTADPDNIEPDSEEEVDQLDSEEGSTTGNSNGKPEIGGGSRTPGETLLPAVRLENIIQADGALLAPPSATSINAKKFVKVSQETSPCQKKAFLCFQ